MDHSSEASRNSFLPPRDEFSLCLWNLGILIRSVFNTRTMSILPHPCQLRCYTFASSIAIAHEEQGYWIAPAKNCMDETTFVENAAEILESSP